MTREDVLREIYNALKRVNEMRDPFNAIVCAGDTRLYGRDGCLDSLGLVSLIMDVEMAVREQTGTSLVLSDAQAMSQRRNPFRDVRSFADYVMSRLRGVDACTNVPSS
jgi:acyl carrier protein